MVDFGHLLQEGRPLLADGAVATNLFAQGLQPGTPPECWNVTHPDAIEALHRAYLEAGADIILTNSFGANRFGLSRHGAASQIDDLNARGARIARRAADTMHRPVLVAGSVGPTGASAGALSDDDAASIFAEQMQALAEGGIDAIWIETMSSVAEARAAARAAAAVGLPYALMASLHEGSGLGPAALASLAATLDPRPVAIGFNCGTGPEALAGPLEALRAAAPEFAIVGKPNAGSPVLRDGSWLYPSAPEDFRRFVAAVIRIGTRIVGGCCGTTPAYINAMHGVMRERSPEDLLRGLP